MALTRHLESEQNRAPAVLPHHHELARPTPDQPRSHPRKYRRDYHGTGLSVEAQLDTGDYPTGAQVSDARMAALPIARHGFHSDWNYTLHPGTPGDAAPSSVPTPPPESLLTTLTIALNAIIDNRREATRAPYQQAVDTAGDHGTRPHAPRSGRPPTFAFPDRLLATILHLRLSLPPDTLAHLFSCNRSTICRAIRETRQLLDQHGAVITPAPNPSDALINQLAGQH